MNCRAVRGLLADYAEGKLSEALEQEVEKHLETCAACEEEYSFYIESNQALLHSPILPAAYEDTSVSNKVMERILQENKWAAPVPERAREIPVSTQKWVTGLAIALLLACFLPVFMLGKQLSEVMQPDPFEAATDMVISAEALPFSTEGVRRTQTISYGVIATASEPIPYHLPPKEQTSHVHYGLLSALFGILVIVVSMSWLSRLKKHAD
ncbi:anti-sigma factor family protein [Aneurinibacillus sp. REN35]|uniref:anti-sigma factor family protein n=1 Tax=Aneurinibacillus sp. REN35 TaxID=3237286 RepID=UPI0035282BB1